jgi:pyruvate dehydrogenase E2 component (dihydrolipoamide acetyltransferase)
MDIEIKMPKFGETMTEGIVTEWLKQEGDQVKKGEPLFKVETDKSVLEVEAEETGILKEILVEENEEVPIGTIIAILSPAG